ncbi:hypothetical protein ACPYO6_04105 [Georgenia sp. Z1344]|uniref:hypothetical protein n=1 Tax=Georgenia sp. Z1344 TaxID=3416706 RepID=UPI003CF41390
MAIELQPEVLAARVRLLSTTVEEVQEIRTEAWSGRYDHKPGWSDLSTINRISDQVSERMYELGDAMTALLFELDGLSRALEDSAALIQGVDEETTDLLEKTRERLSDMELGNFNDR